VACILWGFVQPFPFNIILWTVALVFLLIFLFLVYRSARGPPKIKLAEVRRLIACERCGVETEGPFESGDHVFREVGSCPRCGGRLVVKAIYTIDSKVPLKRQQPPISEAKKE
jgi:DNA-directed RNA polymerase subunit RPC12/RpoP